QPFVARAVRADEAGEVQLQLAPGTYDFVAEADRFQTGFITARNITRPGSVDLTLEQAFAIRGRVHRNGVGVANANISLLGNEDVPRDHAIVTGADGRFEIAGLARDKYRLGVFKHEELIQRIVSAEAPGEVDVALPPAGTLRARVIDAATREPVREFIYSVEPLDATEEPTRMGRPLMERGEASADGTFTVTVSSGAYRVSATATGYTASTPVEVRLTEREPTELQIALDRGATISGRVTDESGTPIAEADVYVFGAEADRMSKRSGPRVAPGTARSAQDGTFSVSGVEPGTATMTVRKEGFVPFRKAVEVSTNTNLDVQLSRGLTIEGVVLRNGKPAPETSVSASTAAVGGDHQPAMTDANGRFVLRGLIAARYTVAAFREDVHTEVRDVDPTKEQELVISLDPKPAGVIYGTVTGLPQTLAGKIVRRVVFVQSDELGAEGLIDDNGNYRIENAPTGNVFVTAQIESTSGGRTSPRKSVNVVAGQQTRVDVDLGGGINVSGRVSFDGKPVPAVRVAFMNEASVGGSATTRADGTYEVTLAAAGTYQILAQAEAVAMRHFQTVSEVRGGETIDIDIREQSIEGTVVDAETRRPIAGAIVTIAPEANVMESVVGESITMPNGRFQILTAASGA
ncbi:MAG TPA: carboxypeptidase regulatory-like domain-containing protein, partial [Thermoanaerobaculia bacterium]